MQSVQLHCYLHLQMMQNAFNNKQKLRVASEYFVIDTLSAQQHQIPGLSK